MIKITIVALTFFLANFAGATSLQIEKPDTKIEFSGYDQQPAKITNYNKSDVMIIPDQFNNNEVVIPTSSSQKQIKPKKQEVVETHDEEEVKDIIAEYLPLEDEAEASNSNRIPSSE